MAITFSDNHDSSGNAKNDENYKYGYFFEF